ncbi:hypothetical protein EMPS_02735 [Entomortierella parvispora]|uniref:C2H2-type domain-containing protein n=1 Tax=Entomortierella parvispora TaxID=205924 RepID=A0A9P3H5A0_9FUNG|nr:hypothetical protein EMPS_02735 [Entomortierella parvispora]
MLRATSKRIMALPSPGVTTTFDCPVVADPPTPLTPLSSAYEDGTEDDSLSHICSSKADHAQLRAEYQTRPLPVEPLGAIDTASSTPYCAAELNLDGVLSGTLDLSRLALPYQWLEIDTFLLQHQQIAQTTQHPQHSPHPQQDLQYQPQPQQQPKQQFQVQLQLPQQQQQPHKPYRQRDQLCVDHNPLPTNLEGIFVFSSPASISASDLSLQVCALNDSHSFGESAVDCTMYWDQMAGLSLKSSDPCSLMATSPHAENLFGAIEDQMSVSSSPPLLVSDFEIQPGQGNQTLDAISPIEPLSPLPPVSPLSRKKRARAKSAPGTAPYPVGDRPHGAEPSASISPRVLPACPRRQSESIVLLAEAMGASVAPVPLLLASTVQGGAIRASKRSRASSVGAASCSQCFKWFSRKNNLDMHVKRVHDKERPFLCVWEDCTKTFAAKGDLVKHERLHTGEKPFACKHGGCEVTFTRSEPLDRHHERDHHDCPKGRTCLREA